MSKMIVPAGYRSPLTLVESELALKLVKDTFERRLSESLRLTRVSAPLFVEKSSGLNDDLNGVERAVSFDVPDAQAHNVEIVHSLAKWKRDALKRYGFSLGEGLYTDMNAIRRDEELDNIHSIYVDQWDWELVIKPEERTIEFLKKMVRRIYGILLEVEYIIHKNYPQLGRLTLPEDIHFITSQELLDRYPKWSAKERENAIAKEYGAVFVMQIGDKLTSGELHDGRAPDYDDWQLNGDILVWFPLLEMALELSSMGIRVDANSLKSQLEKANALERINLPYHQNVLHDRLPLTVGGGIGQSRLCMYFLHKAHIGEVQASLWPAEMLKRCKEAGINLL